MDERTDPDERRMTRAERREQVLDAALGVVAQHGFAGATTDQVARAAGVSQPYVVRMFGSKAELLRALFERTGERVLAAFAAVPPGPDAAQAMGAAYVELVSDRALLLVLLHGFSAGGDAALGAVARRVLGDVARLVRERTGGGVEDAVDFLGHGMLINVLLAVGTWEHQDEDRDLTELAACVVGSKDLAPAGTAP